MGSGEKMNRVMGFLRLLFLCLSMAFFPSCFSDSKQPQERNKLVQPNRIGSSAIFPVRGNVYPLGYYYASIRIGNPARVFDLDIDTGSDLTWVQCDAPCVSCTQPRNKQYKPRQLLHCVHPFCVAIQPPGNEPCENPTDQCDYKVEYADKGSSYGVLVADQFSLTFTNGSTLSPRLAFGCGYDQIYGGQGEPPPLAGVLGLGKGKVGILSQLTQLGLTRNVIGHCLGSQGGFFFFGDDFIPSSRISWIPTLDAHYSSGPADILVGGKPSGIKGIKVIFDSGSSYTYFNSRVYKAVIKLVKASINGKSLKVAYEDKALPICWKGNNAFKSVEDATSFFPTLALSFTKVKNAVLQLPPEAYLIVTERGNACLGMLNGTQVDLGDHNVIGDISLLGKIVIYDNVNKRIVWAPAYCEKLPKVDIEQVGDIPSLYNTFGFDRASMASTAGHDRAEL